jgi:hypothetical protein
MNEAPQGTQKHISDGEFRRYVFSVEELSSEVQRFLKQVGYQPKQATYIGLVQPDFRFKRTTDSGTFELVGMIRASIEEAVDALTKLAAIKAVRRDIDCILVLPPINEYLLIEFLTEEGGRWYFGMKDSRLVMWFCNPDDHTTICPIGAPSDKEFSRHFWMNKMSFDEYMNVRASHLIRERLLAEEEAD